MDAAYAAIAMETACACPRPSRTLAFRRTSAAIVVCRERMSAQVIVFARSQSGGQ